MFDSIPLKLRILEQGATSYSVKRLLNACLSEN